MASSTISILDYGLARDVLKEIRISDTEVDPWRIYQKSDLRERCIDAALRAVLPDVSILVAGSDLGLPPAVWMAQAALGQRNLRVVHAPLLSFEAGAELQRDEFVCLVDDTMTTGSHAAHALDLLRSKRMLVRQLLLMFDNTSALSTETQSLAKLEESEIKIFALSGLFLDKTSIDAERSQLWT